VCRHSRRPAATYNFVADTLRGRGTAFALILSILVLGIGVVACGGNEQAASPPSSKHAKEQSSTGPGQGSTGEQGHGFTQQDTEQDSPDGQTETDEEGPGNASFRKKLEEGDCSVKDDTELVLAQNSDGALLAEAHLYHALAIAVCGGSQTNAKAELDAVEADLLSAESREALIRARSEVPTSMQDLPAVLAPATTNP
jgi:hypothetical protein